MTRRLLFLNGSPHHDGNSVALARRLALLVPESESRWRHLYDEKIAACRGCNACMDGNGCILHDDCDGIITDIGRADAIVFVSPLHFTSLTAPTVALISRFQQFWKTDRVLPARDRKRGGLVVTAGGEYPNMFEPARRVAAAAFISLNVPFAGMVAMNRTDTQNDPDASVRADLQTLATALTADAEPMHS